MLWMALLGCVPATFDVSADDYLTLKPSPDAMVGEDGIYNGGWYESFTGRINPEDALGPDGAFKGWLHFSLQDDRYLISVNLADMGNAGNTAITLLEHATGQQQVQSITQSFGDNPVELNADFTEAVNTDDGSYIRAVDNASRLEFDVRAGDLHLVGAANALFAQDFVQISRYHDGYGILQWYGIIQVEQATLTTPTETLELGPETLGAYDRMAGHRRTHQAWNWVGAVGPATRVSDGAEVMIALQLTTDKEESRPWVDSQKYAVWVDGALHKVPSVEFSFDHPVEGAAMTTDWEVASRPEDTDRVDLVFTPVSVRQDITGYLWFYYTDFRQYCGRLNGTITLGGEVYEVEDLRALGEDSSLVL